MAKRKTTAEAIEADLTAESEAESPSVKLLKAEITNLKRNLREARGGQDVIVETIRDIFDDDPPKVSPVTPPKPTKKPDVEEAVVHLTDLHFGKYTPKFDSAIAAARVREVAEKVLKLTDLRRQTAAIDTCHILLGGDVLEGELIFGHQPHLIDSNVIEQAVRTAPTALAEFVLTMAGHFPAVRVYGVPGNHGRSGGKHTAAHPKTNWDTVAYEVMRLLVAPAVKNVEFDLPMDRDEDWWAMAPVCGHNCLLVHGHKIRGAMGIPWYGVKKKVHGFADIMEKNWKYLFFGHFHTAAKFDINYRTAIATGSIESMNEYAREEMASAGHPKQRVCFFNQQHGLIADAEIYLTAT